MKKLKTVDAVVEDLMDQYPDLIIGLEENLTAEEFATKFHISLGMKIRNEYGLWDNNQALLNDCNATTPDAASSVILKKLWEVLQVAKC